MSTLLPDADAALDVLHELVATEPLFDFLTGSDVAIVGGVVRDSLLGRSVSRHCLLRNWPDVDVAFGEYSDYVSFYARVAADPAIAVSTNSFGGLKVTSESGVIFDFWHWDGDRDSGGAEYWTSRLELVDFGLNAIAYSLTQGRIVGHPRWWDDLRESTIEQLSSSSEFYRELQAMRAIVLSGKLTEGLQHAFFLGPRIRADIRWLASEAPPDATDRACSYVREKVVTRRWPLQAWKLVLQLLERPHVSPALHNSLCKAREDFADDFVTSGTDASRGHRLESL